MKAPQPDLGALASTVHRLAVLLAAGVRPVAAWEYLPKRELSLAVVSACHQGASIPEAIMGAAHARDVPGELAAWRGLATAWAVATDAGAPLAPALRGFAESLRDLAQAQREIGIALAAPTATAKLVLALPAVGILFGLLLGFNSLGTLLTTVPGLVCLALGGGLMLAASRWNRRLVLRAQPRDLTPGLGLDLLAIALSGGGSIDRALATVAAATERFGAEATRDPAIEEVLELSARAGVPAAELLRSAAVECRRDALAEIQSRARALSVRLMIPMGVCILPAFMLLSVAPLLLAVLEQTQSAR